MNNTNAIKTINKIVENKQHEKIHGVIVDLFTASLIQQVYNALGKENKVKMNQSMSKNSEGLIRITKICNTIKIRVHRS